MFLVSVLECAYLMWFIAFLYSVSGNEVKDDTRQQEMLFFIDSFREFCKSFNLIVSVLPPDHKMHTVTVNFELTDIQYAGCYQYYDVFLQREEKLIEDKVRVVHDFNKQKTAKLVFEDVACGEYRISISPLCTYSTCPQMLINYSKSVNMSSHDCNPLPKTDELISLERSEKKVLIIKILISAISVFTISGIIFCIYLSVQHRPRNEGFAIENNIKCIVELEGEKFFDTENSKIPSQNIEVYILHYYDKKETMKQKVEILKDFLRKSSFYSTVKAIEDELPIILFDVNDWLNNVLEERGENGNVRRIILIASKEENEEEEYGIENLIFSEIVKKLNDNVERCLTGYSNLFVVQLDGSLTCSEKFKNIVRRDRYLLSGESVREHLIDLCLNLCSGSKLDLCEVEKNLEELLLKHPVRHLGSEYESFSI